MASSSQNVQPQGWSSQQGASGASQSNQFASSSADPAQPEQAKKKKTHRGGQKRRRKRRQSFVPRLDAPTTATASQTVPELHESHVASQSHRSQYLGMGSGRRLSETSLESEALLDHRDQAPLRTRRDSRAYVDAGMPSYRPNYANPFLSNDSQSRRLQRTRAHRSSGPGSEAEDNPSDRTPLLGQSQDRPASSGLSTGYGLFKSHSKGIQNHRSISNGTSASSKHRRPVVAGNNSSTYIPQDYDINNPPSVPPSPKFGPEAAVDDVLLGENLNPTVERRATTSNIGDQLIDIDGDPPRDAYQGSNPPTPKRQNATDLRRHTMAIPAAEGDVCFPVEGMSELGEEDFMGQHGVYPMPHRRKRARQWPDLSVLDEWSREEKEERSDGIRAKKISEPVLVGGRLRPQKYGWHREEEDAPYRFTYFNEEFPSTIHSQTISELVQPGQGFRELFIPDPPELSDESSDEEDTVSQGMAEKIPTIPSASQSKVVTRQSSIVGEPKSISENVSAVPTPPSGQGQSQRVKPKRYGARPTFWLDVLSPTETEMKVIQKAFGIHPLTAEDILLQEAREKVELFRNYYFVNYRTFEQDSGSDDYLEPVNMYVVVFREGVLSFHFSMTPHPANVRRRIRQLKDYLVLTADWISYAIIDDITDVFVPLISSIEKEVDDIDDAILQLHTNDAAASKGGAGGGNGSAGGGGHWNGEKRVAGPEDDHRSEMGEAESGGDMLRRVGQGRKKVMGLYRLLGNKADVIKGFAKRCNEQWEIAPRSEIGLYLGDIQDHILTMTSNLSHYETLLSRAHSNYLAQINIRMNERQEQTADVLGRLTVLGTIVLPMNIITGMWGMNVLVPGQETENLWWFWSITAGLVVFGVSCFFIAKRVYKIV